jgi:hypothetical protein
VCGQPVKICPTVLNHHISVCSTAVPQVLFKQAKLRNAPFEWVYDGLAPALLPQVLARSKGMPLALALVVAAVARRLGVRMRLLCAPEAIQSSTASGEG